MKELPRNPSFTPSPGLRADLNARRDTVGVTGRLNQIWDRYALLCAQPPKLTDEERQLLGNTLSGSYIEPLLIKHLDAELEDSDTGEPSALRDLAARVREMSLAERVAMIESLGF
ncbi:hypothetical protein [Billgrantia bachuensis]|uniref:Uncharacterized protein n=1 Tax=Billgrantia bachuensis TaxID=2717286 RepID=A0ABX0PT21_9GAMM|nr:hypothetical protein [Halomonas bachuensis]NIC05247.1 hypothetical protein [Halomonas bachuensis]